MALPFSLRRTGRLANRARLKELPPAWRAASPRDYAKWSALRYGFRAKEDHDAEEETQARGACASRNSPAVRRLRREIVARCASHASACRRVPKRRPP